MRTPRLLAAGSSRINMTPMIDVVFLLIIFFLVSSHLAKQENYMPLDLPRAAAAMGETPQESTIVVNVAADGNWYAMGQQVDLPQLANLLRRQRMRAAEPVRLRLRTDAQVAYRRVAPILRLAAQEGIGDIAFSVFEERAR